MRDRGYKWNDESIRGVYQLPPWNPAKCLPLKVLRLVWEFVKCGLILVGAYEVIAYIAK